jgi:hypothetical protein
MEDCIGSQDPRRIVVLEEEGGEREEGGGRSEKRTEKKKRYDRKKRNEKRTKKNKDSKWDKTCGTLNSSCELELSECTTDGQNTKLDPSLMPFSLVGE